MEPIRAKRIGGKQACRIALFAVIILEFIWLLMETRGDFANGIIFFMNAQSNIYVIGFFVLLFSVTYFLGRYAGRDVIIHRRNYVWVGFRYALLASAIIIGYLFVVYALHNVLQEALHAILQVILAVTTPMIVIWLFSVRQIKKRAN